MSLSSFSTTWHPIAAVPASMSDPHFTLDGLVSPATEVTVTGEARLYVHMATIGPEGDAPEARHTPDEARRLATALWAAADAVEAGL